MFTDYLRRSPFAALMLSAVRIYIGWQWFTAGWKKVYGGSFDASGFLLGALKQTSGDHPAVQPWWGSVLKNIIVPNVEVFNFLVAWGELFVGISLILGLFTSFSILMALTMNFSYLFSGTTSVNPQMVVLSLFILTGGANAGRFGLDRWALPFLSSRWKKGRMKEEIKQSA